MGFDGCLKDADWEVGYGPSCIVQTTDGLRCQEGETKERAEKDGTQDLTITYACARMRYGRGRCVIGTLCVVDRARVLLPLIRKKCHDALLWQLKWNLTSRGCDVWCGEPSSLLQERAAMRLAAEVELDDRVLLRSRAKTGLKLRS